MAGETIQGLLGLDLENLMRQVERKPPAEIYQKNGNGKQSSNRIASDVEMPAKLCCGKLTIRNPVSMSPPFGTWQSWPYR